MSRLYSFGLAEKKGFSEEISCDSFWRVSLDYVASSVKLLSGWTWCSLSSETPDSFVHSSRSVLYVFLGNLLDT